jgi:hypothetical protein
VRWTRTIGISERLDRKANGLINIPGEAGAQYQARRKLTHDALALVLRLTDAWWATCRSTRCTSGHTRTGLRIQSFRDVAVRIRHSKLKVYCTLVLGRAQASQRLTPLVPHQATFALLIMVLSRLSWALRFRQAMYRWIMLACLVLGG